MAGKGSGLTGVSDCAGMWAVWGADRLRLQNGDWPWKHSALARTPNLNVALLQARACKVLRLLLHANNSHAVMLQVLNR